MNPAIIPLIGYAAVFFQSIRVIPQVVKGFRTKSVKDVSLGWIITASIGAVLWIIYGSLIISLPIISGNVINLICYALLMYQKKFY